METTSAQTADPRQLLKNELESRCSKNPRYSLRAFAKGIGISHTVLSLVLSGKRPLSKKATIKVAQFLGLDPASTQKLFESRVLKTAPFSEDDYHQLTMDQFAVISDGCHYGILSLLDIPGARFEAKWIAKSLEITDMQAKLAMERLVRLELVAKNKTGRWKQNVKPIRVNTQMSTQAARRFHHQALNKAIHSLENDPYETRDISAATFSVDPKHLPYVRERIRDFRLALMRELEEKGSPKEVYQLCMQFFPITHLRSKNEKV